MVLECLFDGYGGVAQKAATTTLVAATAAYALVDILRSCTTKLTSLLNGPASPVAFALFVDASDMTAATAVAKGTRDDLLAVDKWLRDRKIPRDGPSDRYVSRMYVSMMDIENGLQVNIS